MNYLHPPLLDRLAREYVLGTLAGAARRRFDRVLVEAPAASLAVTVWQERLAVLSASMPPMVPRVAVWQGVEQRLFPRPARIGWWHAWLSPHSWGGALAGVLLCTLVLRLQPGWIGMEPQSPGLPASYVGLLTDAEGRAAILASSRRHGRLLTVKLLQPLAVPPGRVVQLWALPADGSAALPIGVVPDGKAVAITLADTSEKLFSKVSQLAVSLEPAAARSGDKPSGPFVLRGHCVKLW